MADPDRRSYIGGTDAAAVAGVGLWGSPYSVWAEKVGDRPASEPSERMRWGLVLEYPVAREWAKQNHVKQLRKATFFRMEMAPHVGGHPDFLGVHPEDGEILIETKLSDRASEWTTDDGEDRVPLQYFLQVQHYLLCTRLDVGYLVVLVRGNELRSYRIERDQEVINGLLVAYEDLWINHVLTGVPPEVDGHEATAEALKRRNPRSEDSEIVADVNMQRILGELLQARKDEEEATARKVLAENRIKAKMGSVARLIAPGISVSWKANKPSTVVAWDLVAKGYRQATEQLLEILDRIKEDNPDDWETVFTIRDSLDTIESLYTVVTAGARPFRVTTKDEE